MENKFVSYLRDSSQRQRRSSLGLEAQREAVSIYVNRGIWTLVAEIIEVDSGKRNNWPQLENALRLCHVHRATLLIAKLNRLARNVAFVSALMESGVKFQAVDLPEANDLTVHIMVATAESERRAISARIKAGLAAAKARGTKLGGLRWDITSVAAEGRQVRQEKAANYRADILPLILEKQKRGTVTLSAIADALNADNTLAPRGGQWSPVQVKRILDAASKGHQGQSAAGVRKDTQVSFVPRDDAIRSFDQLTGLHKWAGSEIR